MQFSSGNDEVTRSIGRWDTCFDIAKETAQPYRGQTTIVWFAVFIYSEFIMCDDEHRRPITRIASSKVYHTDCSCNIDSDQFIACSFVCATLQEVLQ